MKKKNKPRQPLWDRTQAAIGFFCTMCSPETTACIIHTGYSTLTSHKNNLNHTHRAGDQLTTE